MTDKFIKNIDFKVHLLTEQISYQDGQVGSKTLAQNKALSLTLFAFDKGKKLAPMNLMGMQ